ncbi:ilvG, partial [Symbiodinium sp. KB8]
ALGCDLGPSPDFAAIGKAYGGNGVKANTGGRPVASAADLTGAMDEAFKSTGIFILHVLIDPLLKADMATFQDKSITMMDRMGAVASGQTQPFASTLRVKISRSRNRSNERAGVYIARSRELSIRRQLNNFPLAATIVAIVQLQDTGGSSSRPQHACSFSTQCVMGEVVCSSQQTQRPSAADFIFVGERGLELVHPGDYSDYSASLNQAEADALCEISFDDDAFSAPVADCVLGVCTCSETWNPLAATEFQIVLQSPQRDKGVVLMAVWHSEDAEDAVRNIWEKLEVSEQLAVKGSDAYRSVRARVRALAEVEKSHYHVLAFLKLLVSNDYIRRAPADEALVQEIGKLALDLRVKECDSCPICLEAIAAEDAVMRCSGAGGGLHQLHHYFHAECLREWIRTASNPKCPMCRSNLQLNGARLECFLEGTATLSDDERTYLQALLDGASARQDWSDMNFIERTGYAGSLAASAAAGFAQVFFVRSGYWASGGLAPRTDLRLAQLAGAGAAVAFRIWRGR